MIEIIYRDENGQDVAAMRDLDTNCNATKEQAIVIAQKYLQQFPTLTAHVMTAESETVVSRATGWQMMNG